MGVYNAQVTRDNVGALIPEAVQREIIQNAPAQSNVLRLARRLPNMTSAQQRMPVLSALPTAYFVTGDTGLKQTTTMAWANKYLNAEELAVIVPIPEAVLDDAGYDIWSEVRPRIEEAVGRAIDAAVLFGTNAPASWPDDIFTGATAAGHAVPLGSVGADLYDDIMAEGGLLNLVEEDGYMVNGHVAAAVMRAKLRGLRSATEGLPIFMRSMQQAGQYELDGSPIYFDTNGTIDPDVALMFTGDWRQMVYAVRQDLTFTVSNQAVIQDGTGAIIYNMFQQDMVALRVVMRLAWQLPNPLNLANSDEETRYPFSVLTPAGA